MVDSCWVIPSWPTAPALVGPCNLMYSIEIALRELRRPEQVDRLVYLLPDGAIAIVPLSRHARRRPPACGSRSREPQSRFTARYSRGPRVRAVIVRREVNKPAAAAVKPGTCDANGASASRSAPAPRQVASAAVATRSISRTWTDGG